MNTFESIARWLNRGETEPEDEPSQIVQLVQCKALVDHLRRQVSDISASNRALREYIERKEL